jgi:hypothetical protein
VGKEEREREGFRECLMKRKRKATKITNERGETKACEGTKHNVWNDRGGWRRMEGGDQDQDHEERRETKTKRGNTEQKSLMVRKIRGRRKAQDGNKNTENETNMKMKKGRCLSAQESGRRLIGNGRDHQTLCCTGDTGDARGSYGRED